MPHDYPAFLHALGWLAALAFAALAPSLPGRTGRAAVWLAASCALRLLVAGQALVTTAASGVSQTFAAIIGGMLWWEFARRVWNEHARHRLSAAWHVLPLECLALTVAIRAGAGGMHVTSWQWPIELAFAAMPAALAGTALLLVWRQLGSALRVAGVVFALQPVLEAFPSLMLAAVLAPWLVTAGFAVTVLAAPATRTRAALGCLTGLGLVTLAAPAAVTWRLAQIEEAAQDDVAARAHRATASLQGVFAARLAAEGTPGAATMRQLEAHARALRAADPLLHAVQLRQVRDGRVLLADLTRTSEHALRSDAATSDDLAGAVRLRSSVEWPPTGAKNGTVVAHQPLLPGRFETPSGWLVLHYPAAFWDVQREHARRSGITLAGLLAGFCAMGFVLAARQSIENAQRVELERARSADQAKTEFLACLSHEMRTPLQTILGRAELLRAASDTGPGALRHAAAIENQSLLLLRLVSDLLDLGTLEAGKFQLRPHPFSLRQALAAVEDTVRAPAQAKRLALAFQIAADVPDALVGDETRLRQVLGNLLGNAVKYTSTGRVDFTVDCDRSEANAAALVFRVADTGPGLPPDKIPQLFTLFTRLDSGETFTREGTGVGLALVRRLCDLMGGSVMAANRAGGGAEFTARLTFPLGGSPARTSADASAGAPRRRVLIAEDNAAVREFLVEAAQALGHEPIGVADGHAALAAAAHGRFDAVLLDVNLPGRDGISVARELAVRSPRPRLIGCSAEAFATTRSAAREAGMDVFLEKPVALAALADALADPTPPAPDADASEPNGTSVFARLQSAEFADRTRALLVTEWPGKFAAATAAIDRADFAPVRALAHYLLSSAQLAGDPELLVQCERLGTSARSDEKEGCHAALGQVDAQVATWAKRKSTA